MSPDTAAHPVAKPRGAFRLLFDRLFGTLFWGKMISVVGVWTHSLVAAVVVFEATGSALMVGLVGVAQFGPQLLLSPTSGKWADQGDPARQVLLGRLLCTIGSAAIALLLFLMPNATSGQVTATVLAGSLVLGIGFVVGGPAMQSMVPSLIREGELPTAMALNTVPMTVGRMVGPVVGAFIAAQLNSASAFAASAICNLMFVLIIAVVRFPAPPKRSSDRDYRVRTALLYVWRDRPLGMALLAVATVGFASDPAITLAPSMAQEVGGDTHLVGQLSAAFGVGAAVALALLGLLGGRISSARVAWIGLWVLTVGSGVLAVAGVPWLALVGFGLAGFGFGASMTGLSTVVQERAPDELRGRIMALWMVGFVGSRPLAAAILGGGADLWSAHAAFIICAAIVLVTVLVCRPKLLTSIAQ